MGDELALDPLAVVEEGLVEAVPVENQPGKGRMVGQYGGVGQCPTPQRPREPSQGETDTQVGHEDVMRPGSAIESRPGQEGLDLSVTRNGGEGVAQRQRHHGALVRETLVLPFQGVEPQGECGVIPLLDGELETNEKLQGTRLQPVAGRRVIGTETSYREGDLGSIRGQQSLARRSHQRCCHVVSLVDRGRVARRRQRRRRSAYSAVVN
jgi:hypothetical protein